MDYLLLARVSKFVGLIGFLLPWVTVSCSGNVILEATGVQLMTGDPQPAGMLEGADRSEMDDAEPAIGVILACAAAALGLGLSFVLKGKQAAGAILAGAVLTIGLSYYSLESLRAEMTREASEQEDDMARAVANAIRTEKKEGFWVTVGGAGVGGVLALIVLVGVGVVRRPEETTPPT
jgi:hypothetical protein